MILALVLIGACLAVVGIAYAVYWFRKRKQERHMNELAEILRKQAELVAKMEKMDDLPIGEPLPKVDFSPKRKHRSEMAYQRRQEKRRAAKNGSNPDA